MHRIGTAKYFYYFLVFLQALGAGTILWIGVPLYRDLLSRSQTPLPLAEVVLPVALSVSCIHFGYWIGRRQFPAVPVPQNALIGHIVLFLGRLGFTYVTGLFSVIFYTRIDEVEFTPAKTAILVAVMFSIFCWSQEIERIGRALVDSKKSP